MTSRIQFFSLICETVHFIPLTFWVTSPTQSLMVHGYHPWLNQPLACTFPEISLYAPFLFPLNP